MRQAGYASRVNAVRTWLRDLTIYSPGIVLLVAGILMLLTVPIAQSAQCSCPGVCSCPSGTVYHPLGAILVAGAVVYLACAFVARRATRGWFNHWPRPLN